MGLPEKRPFVTQEEYLEKERLALQKSEYYKGEVFTIAGATREHILIVGNVLAEAKNFLKGKSCNTFSNDLRVLVNENGLFTYPDLIIVCGKEEYLDNNFNTLLNPTIIIEILSASTTDYDRGSKFMLYCALPSLKEYVTISSLDYLAKRNIFNLDGTWTLIETSDRQGFITLQSIGLKLKMEDIYYNLEFNSN